MAMVESTPPWMVWASMSGWLTPTFFFLLLSLVIGTIALTSHKSHQNHHHGHHHHQQQQQQQYPFPRALSRGASMLERLRSFNFNQYRYKSDDVPLETAPHPQPVTAVVHEEKKDKEEKREEEEEADVVETLEDAYKNFKRSHSDSTPVERSTAGGGIAMRKATSEKAAKQKEEDKEEDKEVDARADDFINRFRKQLQLQRLESLLRNRREQQHHHHQRKAFV